MDNCPDLHRYQQAVHWLFSQIPNYQQQGATAYKPGLNNIRALCALFDDPHLAFPTVHIAGTNGKGSTSSMVASMLQSAGFNVGLYTSPHLIDFTERIKVNGVAANKVFVTEFIEQLQKASDKFSPSFFEFTTVMAFAYFRHSNVDIAVIETGLGGRLDATNIISPLVGAITNVDFDHTDLLGSTLEQIAREKAGIIKTEVPIVCGEEKFSVRKVIQNRAAEQNAPFIDATTYTTTLNSDLKGLYQKKNIKVALALVDVLDKKGFCVTHTQKEKGLLNVVVSTGLLGRWQVLSTQPLIICDTAHNPAGLHFVFEQLQEIAAPMHIVLGFVQDKNMEEIISLLPKDAQYYFIKPAVTRGRDPHTYEHLIKKEDLNYKIFPDVQKGYLAAFKNVKTHELIFVGGSNFVVGEFLEKNLEK